MKFNSEDDPVAKDGEPGRGVGLPRPFPPLGAAAAAGRLVFRPWADGLAVPVIGGLIFPLVRAGAAAEAAKGSPERFAAELELERPPGRWLESLLRSLERRRLAHAAQEQAWQRAYFGSEGPGAETLVSAEVRRRRAAITLSRPLPGFLPLRRRVPQVRWEIASPAAVEAAQGARLQPGAPAYPVPPLPEVQVSHGIESHYGKDHWLQFPSPLLGDSVTARVHVPAEGREPPTVIYLHGICMEPEFWPDGPDPASEMARRGIRVVRPEGPWHSRRRLEGWFGGEPVMARGPLGFLELFQAWAAEVAVLIDWARRTSAGPVALGGVSLGSLASQVIATAARDWPARLQPDAMALVVTSGSLLEVVSEGSLARALKIPARFADAGWDDAALRRWLPLLEPQGRPVMTPSRIVMLLGERDDLTPYAGGRALAEAWGLPPENLFTRRQGHFTAALGLAGDDRPLRCFEKILWDLKGA